MVQTVSYIIIFGAAVKTNGEPSGAMKRRVDSAVLISNELKNAVFIVSGGIGKNKTISEAVAMKRLLLNSGIIEEQIIIENKATDTLSSVVHCTAILNSFNNVDGVYVCSDTYHIPRCRWLFFLSGIKTHPTKVLSGLRANGLLRWTFYYVREIVATPYGTILVGLDKLRLKTKE